MKAVFVPATAAESDREQVELVEIDRVKLYPVVARPGGFAWKWEYRYRTDGSGWLTWSTSLREVREMVKRRYPNALVTATWTTGSEQ